MKSKNGGGRQFTPTALNKPLHFLVHTSKKPKTYGVFEFLWLFSGLFSGPKENKFLS
jgi:hypothetical protein